MNEPGRKRKAWLSKMYQKKKGLAPNRKNLAKIDVTESKQFKRFFADRRREKKG
jgi:hypothetical protein